MCLAFPEPPVGEKLGIRVKMPGKACSSLKQECDAKAAVDAHDVLALSTEVVVLKRWMVCTYHLEFV
jgi:hypothetical protein